MTAPRWLQLALLALLVTVFVRCAWMSDDAYITLRSVDHWIGGHGLRYNVDERVQAYTHPLWMLVLAASYAVTREAWLTPMAVGLGTSIAAAWVLGGPRPLGGAVAFAALLGSKAAVDYATSGLENPLENLLLVGFATVLIARPAREGPILVLLASLLAITRLDSLLLVVPALLVAVRDRRQWPALVLACAPVVLWHSAALVYYGALLPNTALAKLGTGIPRSELAAQALIYARFTLATDPITLVTIGLGAAAGLFLRDARTVALAIGIGLHLLWLGWIGGDFMGGRFFVAPLWVAAFLLTLLPWRPLTAGIAIAATALTLLSPYAPLRSGPGYTRADPLRGVVDERGYYWRGTGLWGGSSWADGPRHAFGADGRKARSHPVAQKSVIGLYGFYAGPEHHVVDRLGLADPLLARMVAEHDPKWRIGHFRRAIPPGYISSIRDDRNRVADPELHRLYDAVRRVTRGPLWTAERWEAIVGLHLGRYPVDRERWRYPTVRWIKAGDPPVSVDERGAGLRTAGWTGSASFAVSAGTWTVYVERGDRARVRTEHGPFDLSVDGVDRVVLFPDGEGRVEVITR